MKHIIIINGSFTKPINVTERKKEKKKEKSEMKTFTVPFALEEFNEGFSISNNGTQLSQGKIINQAFKFHSEGNILEAIKYYKYCINQGFNNHIVFSNYGMILKNLGKLEEAELSTRNAIKIKPDYAEAHSNLGVILTDLGNLKEAEFSYRKAIEINPYFANAHYNIGKSLKDLGNLKEAELSTRKAIELNPLFVEAHTNLGIILKDLGKLQEAELSIRKAIKIKPDYAEAYASLGNIFRELGKLKEAEISQRKAITLKSDLFEAHYNLVGILSDLGRSEEFLLLSKYIQDTRSIDQGYKLQNLLLITITNLLNKDFSELIFNIDRIKDLINKGAINNIKSKKNKKYFLSFFLFINSLYPLLNKNSENLDLDKIPHFGESNCLSFAHQTISLNSKLNQIKPVLITGAKAWHFANKENNRLKDSLIQQVKNHTYSDKVFISFGEIDCRKDKYILKNAIKEGKGISEVCKETIKGYLNHMEITLSPIYAKRYYFGVPAPTAGIGFPDELDMKRNEMIRIFNSFLKEEVLSRGSYFLDVYEMTSTEEGENNNLYMCDKTHLSPKCLSILFENHLYKADSYCDLTS